MENNPELRSIGIVNVAFGKEVTVVQPTNLYGCTIGERTFVGPFVEIQRDTTIGKRCRIQSHAFICELVTIGDDCFVSHGAMFINDLFEQGDRRKESVSFGAQLLSAITSASEPTPPFFRSQSATTS